MNEAETRADLIDPALADAGWGVVEDSRVRREYRISQGRIQSGGGRLKPVTADYVLMYRGKRLAPIEAKARDKYVGEGVGQAKEYADRLRLQTTFATNGLEIYQINMQTGEEGIVDRFPTPQELWEQTFAAENEWRDRFAAQPYNDISGSKPLRFYQENAVEAVVDAIAVNEDRILLTLATGTGKTYIAFQIAWKLFQTRWNLQRDGSRRPRILFLADRNILANQAFNAFNAFPEDALVRIRPDSIRKYGRVPTNGSIFFTIFQTFMSGDENDEEERDPYFGDYPADYFDLIIIDECHRGGANDESSWREILKHFSPAVQLGLTATPKRKHNADTYSYFGKPVYEYSLKDGINDGYLTPFRVKRIQSTVDEYIYTTDDEVLHGDPKVGEKFTEADFNRTIEIREREEARVVEFLRQSNPQHKTIVFCATQEHAALVRDLINRNSSESDPLYCCRVTANDGQLGEQHLKAFQNNEKTIPTVLTTSRKLSTGVDAPEVRNIVLLRPCNNMIEFKQIIGRGTRLSDGKDYFTVYDFVDAYQNFFDDEWDGPPDDPESPEPRSGGGENTGGGDIVDPPPPREKIRIKLADGKTRQIQSMTSTSFWDADGRPLSAEQFIERLFGTLPDFFTSEQQLRQLWATPATRKALLDRLAELGFDIDRLNTLRELIDAENSDLFDVLEYVSFAVPPISRSDRVENAGAAVFENLSDAQKDFVGFVLERYVASGVEVLFQNMLPELLKLKYGAIADGVTALGGNDAIKTSFIEFQRHLYEESPKSAAT